MIVFVSNYYNHHQAPFSEAMYRLTEGQFRFVATEPMSEERLKMGWGGEGGTFVLQYADNSAEIQQLINEADVVIFGSAPYATIEERMHRKKLTLIYSERLYKQECPRWQLPLRRIKYHKQFGRYENTYLLCASAYTASDYARTKTFVGKAYKWGYFPEVKRYGNIEMILDAKRLASILWVARFIGWKHPELPIQVAKRLKDEGYTFELNMIGSGELEESMRRLIVEAGVEDCVHMLGSMKPADVRAHMEEAQIFLFTSDRGEGWGAVLNESMNSGCAVVADRAIGSVPFLLEHETNGLIYEDGDFESLYASVKRLLDEPSLCNEYGRRAYETMTTLWNAETAAERLLVLIEHMKSKTCTPYAKGPCSKSE